MPRVVKNGKAPAVAAEEEEAVVVSAEEKKTKGDEEAGEMVLEAAMKQIASLLNERSELRKELEAARDKWPDEAVKQLAAAHEQVRSEKENVRMEKELSDSLIADRSATMALYNKLGEEHNQMCEKLADERKALLNEKEELRASLEMCKSNAALASNPAVISLGRPLPRQAVLAVHPRREDLSHAIFGTKPQLAVVEQLEERVYIVSPVSPSSTADVQQFFTARGYSAC
jgi:hypothetical protein